jgi:hypothetical protein
MPGCRSSRRAESWKTAGRIPSALTIFDSRDSWRPVSSGFADQDNPFADPIPSGRWPGVAWLEARGLLPEFAGRLQRHLSDIHASAPATRDAEWNAVLAALATFW